MRTTIYHISQPSLTSHDMEVRKLVYRSRDQTAAILNPDGGSF